MQSLWRLACLAAVATFGFLWLVAGNLYIRLLDEGIYLEGAARIVDGQAPYRDFFALTGPGCFWLVAGLFQLLGVKLWVARLLPVTELALLAGAVFWLTARMTSRLFGALLAIAYLSLMAVNVDTMVVNHRLDSAALAVLAVAASSGGRPAMAGVCAAAAAWATPPMLVVSFALFYFERAKWRRFLLGMAAVSLPALLWLAVQGALIPMFQHLLWSGVNYAGANRAAYGSIVGGWAAIFSDASGGELVVRAIFTGYCLMLPAILPAVVLVASLLRVWRTREEWVLVVCAAAMLASSYPRPNITNLRYLCALFVVLSGILLFRFQYWRIAMGGATFLSAVLLLYAGTNIGKGELLETPRGVVRFPVESVAMQRMLQKHVRPGDSMFVFPYEPVASFLVGGRNPARYSFLQPGMMTVADEQAALEDLKRQPPRWVYYSEVPPEAYLRIWPTSDPTRLHMPQIEGFVRAQYREVDRVEMNGLPFRLLGFTGAR
ncbi:MAG: hypothetical protein U0R19_18740 [Bryobacteraceae bacterium]